MDFTTKAMKQLEDTDIIYSDLRNSIDKELSNMKKVVDSITQLRVQAAYLESDLMLMLDSSTWLQISELTGLGSKGMDVALIEESHEIVEHK